MNKTDAYEYLKEKFVATLPDELIPGIFHNFANPLNGIMGRSTLMQRRLTDFIEKIETRYPDVKAEMEPSCTKLLSDIDAIVRESEKFYDLFRTSTGKFHAIGDRDRVNLNLSGLVQAEMGFADFYLDFKHSAKKDIQIDQEMPDISGITAYYSMSLWALIRQSAKHIHESSDDTFRIATAHDDRWVSVSINNIDGRLLQEGPETLPDRAISGDPQPPDVFDEQEILSCALRLLKQSSPGVEIAHEPDTGRLTIRVPYRR